MEEGASSDARSYSKYGSIAMFRRIPSSQDPFMTIASHLLKNSYGRRIGRLEGPREQYGSTQFIPATNGLKDFSTDYEMGKSFKAAVYNASVAWNNTRRARIFAAPYSMTPEYEAWRFRHLNDKIPNINSEGTQSIQERKIQLQVRPDQARWEIASLQKGKDELARELLLEKEVIKNLERHVKKKRAIEGVLNEELINRIKEERRRAETYKQQYLEHKDQVEALTHQVEGLHVSASEERERARLRDERKNAQLRHMERSVRRYKGKAKDSEDNQAENQALKTRIEEMEMEIQSLKDQVASYERGIQPYEIPMVDRLRSAAQAIWAQEEDMAHLMAQVHSVAQ
ncbi:hypothetical protein V6N11_060743 [Hibiscus sabdariffa]|uniref:Uncharacterized protein n=1 Tax=Hibiscus sabdariffa TaxID=183260 RepID=A0ABR2QR93_9ROSI